MKTLQEIKDEVAKEKFNYDKKGWIELSIQQYLQEELECWPEIAKRYAEEYARESIRLSLEKEQKEEIEDYDDWAELGNEINKRYKEMDRAFGVHPILDLIRQAGKFHITRKQ
jgi:hypothetical protein